MNVLTNVELYKVAFLYAFSRMFLLICIIYIPIWINELMKTKTGQSIENIAVVPLAFFASSFAVAIALKCISQNISQKVRENPFLHARSLAYSRLPTIVCRSFTQRDHSYPYLDAS
jgi:hypothetical protein